jgi:branched-chain amino acid transport system permease protein
MDVSSFLVQGLNSVQYGFLLFLVASGLTLIFGILGVINLAHGSFFMIGAYLAHWLQLKTGNLFLAIALGLPLSFLVGLAVERLAIRFLYARDHLYQVLLTYGLILIFNELQRIFWGNDVHGVPIPSVLDASVPLNETQSYPVYRFFISLACIGVAASMYFVIHRTKLGMLIRAGAANREMVGLLGFRVNRLYALVFALGAALTAFAGMLSAPVNSVYPGMGEHILIISFVVVVIGGLGSIQGAFVGAMLIGFVDTFGKVFVPEAASLSVYAFMAAVLLWRPQGLFGARPA